jgi:hypothetical protein
MVPAEKRREVTLRGIVVPIEWDRRGMALQVAILTPDEGEYVVAEGDAGARLRRCLREEVLARGLLRDHTADRKSVTVLSFSIVGRYEPDEDFGDDLLTSADAADA